MSAPLVATSIAVVGFGNQGRAQAANLRSSGMRVVVGARPGGPSEARARAAGFDTASPAAAAAVADVVALLIPDEAIPELWVGLCAAARPGATIVFAHGFALLYGDMVFADGLDVLLVSPTGPGSALESAARAGERLPAYAAVHQDATGDAWTRAEEYAAAIGCGPVWRTTVREETEVDLFGEQVVLCGGMNALVIAAFETLVEAGYKPEVAYLECVHQLRYLADALHARGIAGLRRGISGTALYGDLTRGPRVVGPESRLAMGEILAEVQSGAFAQEWLAEVSSGRPRLREAEGLGRSHPIEAARRRALGLPEPPREPA